MGRRPSRRTAGVTSWFHDGAPLAFIHKWIPAAQNFPKMVKPSNVLSIKGYYISFIFYKCSVPMVKISHTANALTNTEGPGYDDLADRRAKGAVSHGPFEASHRVGTQKATAQAADGKLAAVCPSSAYHGLHARFQLCADVRPADRFPLLRSAQRFLGQHMGGCKAFQGLFLFAPVFSAAHQYAEDQFDFAGVQLPSADPPGSSYE